MKNESEREIHDNGRVECGDIMRRYSDGTPSRRLCGECATAYPERDGCGEVLERHE